MEIKEKLFLDRKSFKSVVHPNTEATPKSNVNVRDAIKNLASRSKRTADSKSPQRIDRSLLFTDYGNSPKKDLNTAAMRLEDELVARGLPRIRGAFIIGTIPKPSEIRGEQGSDGQMTELLRLEQMPSTKKIKRLAVLDPAALSEF